MPRPPASRATADADSDPITEVIDIPGATVSDTAERRYTAPGFDAGSTQIIDRLPDESEPTEIFFRVAAAYRRPSGHRPAPRGASQLASADPGGAGRHGRSRGRRFFCCTARIRPKAARVDSVKSTIRRSTRRCATATCRPLRNVTCGQTGRLRQVRRHDLGRRVREDLRGQAVSGGRQHRRRRGQRRPRGANVTSYMAYDPSTTSTRSFDLQFRDDQWKICQSPLTPKAHLESSVIARQ